MRTPINSGFLSADFAYRNKTLIRYDFRMEDYSMRLVFCAACGATEDLDLHHLMPRCLGGSDDETNLLTLCRSCHGKAHGVTFQAGHGHLIRQGIMRARAKSGTPWGRRKIPDLKEAAISQALRAGKSIRVTAAEIGVDPGTVMRVKRASSRH
jgi:hypothetical protein